MAKLRLTDTTVDELYQSYKSHGNVVWESTRGANFKTKNLEFVEVNNGYYDIYGSPEAIDALDKYLQKQAEGWSE